MGNVVLAHVDAQVADHDAGERDVVGLAAESRREYIVALHVGQNNFAKHPLDVCSTLPGCDFTMDPNNDSTRPEPCFCIAEARRVPMHNNTHTHWRLRV